MSNDSNSSKKDVKDVNVNSNDKDKGYNKNKFSFILISIIGLISILNLIFLIFVVLNSDNLLNKFYVLINKKQVNIASRHNNKDMQHHFSEHEYFKKNIVDIWSSINKLNQSLSKESKNYKQLEDRVLNETQYTWILNESDYLINLISTHIILNGSINSAIESLEVLDNRLSNFKYPQIISLRKSIKQDLSKIVQKNYVDTTSASLDIDFISSLIDNLPSYTDKVLNKKYEDEKSNNNEDSNMTWYSNIWDDIKSSANNLVKVRKLQGDSLQFVTPDQLFFIKENIKLKLQDARLALIDRNESIYKNDLNFVKKYINKYFDINTISVKDINQRLDVLLSLDLKLPVLNDLLGNTLNTIRSLKNTRSLENNLNKEVLDIQIDTKDMLINNNINTQDRQIKSENDLDNNNLSKEIFNTQVDTNKNNDIKKFKKKFKSRKKISSIPSDLNE